jgi:hypothetical protein
VVDQAAPEIGPMLRLVGGRADGGSLVGRLLVVGHLAVELVFVDADGDQINVHAM